MSPVRLRLPLAVAGLVCAALALPALAPARSGSKHAAARKAAVGHSDDMVARRYFSHDEPDGDGMSDRMRRVGYIRPGDGYSVGENIAWGTQNLATAAEIHEAWMNSAGHRANILRRSFKEIGIGIVLGNPSVSPADAGATYTADFGVRR